MLSNPWVSLGFSSWANKMTVALFQPSRSRVVVAVSKAEGSKADTRTDKCGMLRVSLSSLGSVVSVMRFAVLV